LTEREKMIAGLNYRPGDPELAAARAKAQDLIRRYNATIVGENEIRGPILADLLGACGPGTAIRAPFHVDYGFNIFIGRDVFLNFGCVLLDVCPIRIGDKTQIGPHVQLLAADHPRDAAARDAGLENGRPVTIGRNVWIGGGALILPGVTVGDDAIVGAGAVVTRDVPAGATVAGNPARPLHPAIP
jgi:maltose O-acetyltransferase